MSCICTHCRTPKGTTGIPCPNCGSQDQSVALTPETGQLAFGQGSPGTVADGQDDTGARLIRSRTPAGAQSDERLASDRVLIGIHGPVEVGRKGEKRAIDMVVAALRAEGQNVALEAHWADSNGEDSVLQTVSGRLTLQVITVPIAGALWKDAKRKLSEMSGTLAEAAEWIRYAILHKKDVDDRNHTVLILDGIHAGTLSSREVIKNYLERHKDPCAEFGFFSVWLAGPTVQTTVRIGGGPVSGNPR